MCQREGSKVIPEPAQEATATDLAEAMPMISAFVHPVTTGKRTVIPAKHAVREGTGLRHCDHRQQLVIMPGLHPLKAFLGLPEQVLHMHQCPLYTENSSCSGLRGKHPNWMTPTEKHHCLALERPRNFHPCWSSLPEAVPLQ